MDEVLYLTTEEVAKRLRMNTRTVVRLIKSGKLTAFKAGARWRIPITALDAMIERNLSNKEIQ